MKSDNKKYEVITFLRGYSIFAIILFHYLMAFELKSPFDKLIYGGGAGVHLFILLSGFGLWLSYKKKPLPYFVFIKKRMTKIYIPYILIVSLSALLSIILPLYENSLYAYLGHVFLYKMFDENIIGSYGYPLWYISTIIQFYFIFKFIVIVKQWISNNLLLFVIFLFVSIIWSFVVYKIGHSDETIWKSCFLQYIWEFVLGMVLADNVTIIRNNFQKFKTLKPILVNIAFFTVGAVALLMYGYLALKAGVFGKLFNDIPALIGFSTIALFVYNIKIDFLNRFLIYSGHISLSLYLLHMLLFKILNIYFSLSLHIVVISLALCYIVSHFFNYAINKLIKSL